MTERISKPALKPDKFKKTLCYVLRECENARHIGMPGLFSILYLSDFGYYGAHEEQLTGMAYKAVENMPVPQGFGEITNQMVKENMIGRATRWPGRSMVQFGALVKTMPEKKEKNIIDDAIGFVKDNDLGYVRDIIKNDMPVLATKNGQTIDYELVFYRGAGRKTGARGCGRQPLNNFLHASSEPL